MKDKPDWAPSMRSLVLRAVFATVIAVACCVVACVPKSPPASVPEPAKQSRPVPQSHMEPTSIPAPITKGGSQPRRHVEVTMLGRIDQVKGVDWPQFANSEPAFSARVTEPCDLTIHLLSGKTLSFRAQPMVSIMRGPGANTVCTVFVTPDRENGSLKDKINEIEGLMAAWHATPSDHMKRLLNEFRTYPDPDPGIEFANLRVGSAALDENTEVMFELSRGAISRWSLIASIDAIPQGQNGKGSGAQDSK